MDTLIIKAYKDPLYSNEVGEYVFPINPKPYSNDFSIKFEKPQVIGRSGANIKFSKIDPKKISFEFIIDATGVVAEIKDVNTQINKFKTLAYNYNGEIHSPNYLILNWGNLLFKGRLCCMKVKYTLLKPDGTPLRAFINADFTEFEDEKTIALKENTNSPDLTHVRVITEGDTLPLMCYKIYGDSSYYVKIAQFNKLSNFMAIKPGDKIYFPPIK